MRQRRRTEVAIDDIEDGRGFAQVDYELTDLGRGLWQPVEALGMWAREHQTEIEDARARFDRRNEVG
jgi:DNA-binding HxlR family transcriptional regulator